MRKMVALLAGAMLMAAAGSAWAVPTVRLFDSVNNVTVTAADGDLLDSSAAVGAVAYSGAVGTNWIVNVSTGITKPVLGTAMNPYMDLNSVNVSTSAGSLEILFSETGFVSNPSVAGFTTNVGGTASGNFQVKSYFDTGNDLFAETDALGDLGPFGPGAFSGSGTNLAATGDVDGLYSLTLHATITHLLTGATSFDAELTPVPEPGTMMLLGAGFLGLAIYGKRRKNA